MSFEDHNDSLGSASDLEPATPGPIESSLLIDYAGHTPTIDAEIEEGKLQLAADEHMDQVHRKLIEHGVSSLVEISGRNSRDHGFHDDWPVDVDLIAPGKDRDYQKAITEKLMLMGEELFESFGEIRSGHDPLEIYYLDKATGQQHDRQEYIDGVPQYKPEGFIVEIADLLIRAADLTYLLNGREHLIEALRIKHEYNATRPFKHGRQF